MDGKRLREYWTNEIKALIQRYEQFSCLVCKEQGKKDSSSHAEDGRFVESLIRECLKTYLPKGLEVATGFILRPAVKTGKNGREREGEEDQISGQLDIIVYDAANYPKFLHFENNVVVPPEGVIAIVSVKKRLYSYMTCEECKALCAAARLCRTQGEQGNAVRGPFLALISAETKVSKPETIYKEIKEAYEGKQITFDETIGLIGILNKWSIFKQSPPDKKGATQAKYVCLGNHRGEQEQQHLGLQLLLSGIMSVYYDRTRHYKNRPGFTAFEPGMGHAADLDSIKVEGLR